MTTDDMGKSGGIIIAGFLGNSRCHCLKNTSPTITSSSDLDQDNFEMSYTKQIISSKKSRPTLLVSKSKTEPWIPAPGNYKGRDRNNQKTKKEPFCSVCVDETHRNEYDGNFDDEIEQEVKLLQSRPSVAYRKHSPRNWSQELVLGKIVIYLSN